MRRPVDIGRIRAFMDALGRRLREETAVYLTGGSSAVLEGWRGSTVDLDLKFEPDEEVFAVLPGIKEDLDLNIELASPDHFLPALAGWKDRSRFIHRAGTVSFFHYDFVSQALAKIERGFEQDLNDVRSMAERGLVTPADLMRHARQIEPDLARYPAVDPPSFLRDVEEVVRELGGE